MSLATTADVEALLQINVTDPDDPMVIAMLELAADLIDAELGRPAEGGTELTETHTVRPFAPSPRRRKIILGRFPITDVATVTEDGEALVVATDYTVDLDTAIISRVSDVNGYPIAWETAVDIAVTYTPGTPPGLRAVCAAMVARAFKSGADYANKPTLMAGLRQLTIGRWSATIDSSIGTIPGNALHLTTAEKSTVRAYRDRRA